MTYIEENQKKSRKEPTETNTSKSLEQEQKKLEELVEKYFPAKFRVLETCLSVKAQEMIEGITLPFCLILIGEPASGKTTILDIVGSLPNCYMTDNLTAKSFVTHIANVEKGKLKDIDLLPKIKDRTFIVPDLSPIFSTREDQLKILVGILTRVLDGSGYTSESGVHGSRGYKGAFFFTWLGAVVEIKKSLWKMISYMGPKMYFLVMPSETKTDVEKRKQIIKDLKDKSYQEKIGEIKEQMKKFWDLLQPKTKDKVVWNKSQDDEQVMEKIVALAQVLSRLRAYLPTSDTRHSSGSNYGFGKAKIEDEQRAANAMYNLARGHAIISGRKYIIEDDLRVIIPIILSSSSDDRVDLLRYLIKNDGKLTTEQVMEKTEVTRSTALRNMKQLQKLSLVDEIKQPTATKQIFAIKLKEAFSWLLSNEFRSYQI